MWRVILPPKLQLRLSELRWVLGVYPDILYFEQNSNLEEGGCDQITCSKCSLQIVLFSLQTLFDDNIDMCLIKDAMFQVIISYCYSRCCLRLSVCNEKNLDSRSSVLLQTLSFFVSE